MLFFSYSVVNFIRFFMFVCWGIVVRSAEWCSVFCRVLADRQQCLAIRSQRIRNWFATNFVGVRGYIAECFAIHFGVFATHLQSVQNTFTECSQRVRFLYVTYSHYKSMVFDVQKYGFCRAKRGFLSCKSMVFELQKYGFWFLSVALLQSVRHVSAICQQRIRIRPPHCCNPSAAHSHLISSVVAICLQAKSLNLLCV